MQKAINLFKTMQQAIHQFKTWPAITAKLRSNKRLFTLALLLTAVALVGTAMVVPRGASAQSESSPQKPKAAPGREVKRAATKAAASPKLTATPTPPDYSKIGNALAGVTFLQRQDDIVVNMGSYSNVINTDFYPSAISAIETEDSYGQQNFNGFEIPEVCASCSYSTLYRTQDTTVTTGRFFHTVEDSVVSYPARRQNLDLVDIMTGGGNGNVASFQWTASQPLPYETNSTTISQGYATDFNQDGYDDLLMVYSDYTTYYGGNERFRIATANDINDPSQGFNFGQEQGGNGNWYGDGIRSTAVGDFNGDGQPEIAILRVHDDSVLYLDIFSVDPQTLTITYQGKTPVDTVASFDPNQPIRLAAGNFTGSVNKQLVVAYQSQNTSNTVNLSLFDFANNSYVPTFHSSWDSGAAGITNIKLLTSKFDWASPYDVISLMLTKVDSNNSSSYVHLLTVDPGSYAITPSSTVDVAQTYGGGTKNYVALDIAVGNFNNEIYYPNDPVDSLEDPNLQLAVATGYAQGNQTNMKENFDNGAVQIIQVIDQSTGAMSPSPLFTLPVTQPGGDRNTVFQKLTINTADLQGRSMRLGGGLKYRIEKTQPSMILTAPPMHIDYVTPSNQSVPTVLNFSLAPDAFFSKYVQDTTTGTSYQHGDTTSMSFSGAETYSNSVTLGQTNSAGQLENGAEISSSFGAKQDVARSKDTQYGEFTSTDINLTQQTQMGDVLWFTDSAYYLYVFEVVGQTVCPGGQATCDDSARVPLTLMFSGPTVSSTDHVSAEGQEWYQPLWEYGNILSYPSSYGQLQQQNPTLDTPLNSGNSFATDGSPATETATIVSGGSSSQTWQASQLFTESSDLSVTGAISDNLGVPGFGNVGASATFGVDVNLSGSDGTSSLKVATTTSQSSDAMTINKTAIFKTPSLYQYGLTPIIFGQQAPVGVDQSSTLGTSYPDKVTYGPLRTGFTVDPVGNGGAWWGQNYQTADVGLNHPNRWTSVSSSAPSNGILPSNCISTGTTIGYMDCAFQTDRNPANPFTDMFHDMRGFFITGADHPGVGGQLTTATAGDQLNLQTRVYNNSFTASQRVHVMFFAMRWNSATNQPSPDPNGKDSFFIGEQFLSSIPGFSSEPNAPLNSQPANITFDTAGYDDTSLVFWVSVWQEDAQHNLIKDPTGKGLTTTPAATSVKFADAAGMDEMVANPLAGVTDQPTQTTFSDNVGVYRVPFYIQEKSAAATQAAKQVSSARSSGLNETLQRLQTIRDVSPVQVDVAKPSINLGQGSEVFAVLRNGGAAIDNVAIYFYDGDPAKGGKLFDSERVAHIRAKEDYRVGVMYYPRQCGMHPVYIKVTQSGTVGATASVATPLRVRCIDLDPSDTTPPQLNVTLTANTLSAPNDQTDSQTDNQLDDWMVAVTAQIEVSDQQDPRPDIRLEAITHNGTSDDVNDVAEAEFGTDDRTFLVRAKGAGKIRDGRIYEVIYSATDWAGNKTYVKAYVSVPYDQGG